MSNNNDDNDKSNSYKLKYLVREFNRLKRRVLDIERQVSKLIELYAKLVMISPKKKRRVVG
jgi:hypothetical protein